MTNPRIHQIFLTLSLACLAALPSISAADSGFGGGSLVLSNSIQSYPVSGIKSSSAGLADSSQVLIGPNPNGDFAGREGQIAFKNKGGWTFQSPEPGDQAFNLGTGEQYLFTDQPTLFDGLWIDSKWRRLTPQRPKWKTAGSLGSSATLDVSDHGAWYLVSAVSGDFTITLPDPFGPGLEVMGMELVLEPFDGASGTATLAVAGGGSIKAPDGSLVTSFDLPRGTGTSHVFRLVAGNLASEAAWYVVPGP